MIPKQKGTQLAPIMAMVYFSTPSVLHVGPTTGPCTFYNRCDRPSNTKYNNRQSEN